MLNLARAWRHKDFFSSSLALRQNRLECFSLAKPVQSCITSGVRAGAYLCGARVIEFVRTGAYLLGAQFIELAYSRLA